MSRIRHGNSGYIGFSMSRRAGEAYDNGLAPLSKIGTGPYVRAAAQIIGPAEWHHTSKFCNRTDFYDARAVLAVAAQLKAAKDKTGATIAAKREARRQQIVARRSVYQQARETLRHAAEYVAQAARLEAQAATADNQWERDRLTKLAADRRTLAADWRSAARARVAAHA
jgi:hypothetical protein